ncbi:transposase [Streptomyces asiaticus]|uniref:transposase n=1 Tax=Streptomyces asiaticus TaxID=114695 RepID=UPI003D763D0A
MGSGRAVVAVVHTAPPGRRTAPVDERAVFTAVVYVLTSGCAWRRLPPTFGVSPATAHRRFTAWTKAGVWRRLHRAVLDELGARGELDWTSVIVDAASVRAKKGVRWPGRTRSTAANPAPSYMCCPSAVVPAAGCRADPTAEFRTESHHRVPEAVPTIGSQTEPGHWVPGWFRPPVPGVASPAGPEPTPTTGSRGGRDRSRRHPAP